MIYETAIISGELLPLETVTLAGDNSTKQTYKL